MTALRIRFPPSPRRDGYRFRLAELSLLAAETNDAPAAAAASPGDVDALVLRLQQAGIRRLLADRYISDRVAARPGHAIEVRASAELSRELNDLPRRDTPPYTPCDLEPGIALLVPRGAAALTESRLRAARYHPAVEETALGTLLLLTAAGDECVPQPGPMAWFGDALFAWQEEGQEARDAQRLYAQAQHLLAGQPGHPCAVPLLEEALTRFPDHLPALNAWLALAGPAHPLAGERQARLARLTQPARPCRVRFGNGLRLDGLTVTPTRAAPGSTLTITYYWRAPADVDYVGTATFVHFRQRHLIWQDDHEALAGVPRELIRLQPYEMPLLVERRITIPGDAPPGPYDLTLGLVAGAKGRRVPVRGPEAGLERSVHLSHVFEVTPP